MEIKQIKQNVKIKLSMYIDSDKCKTILQENIIASNDNLITGIYGIKILENTVYIVCCNRDNKTLDYTKLCASIKQARKAYDKMLKLIKYDLEN